MLIKINMLTQKFNTHRHSGMVLAGMTKDLILDINSWGSLSFDIILYPSVSFNIWFLCGYADIPLPVSVGKKKPRNSG